MPAAEWRVARLATRRRTAITRAPVGTVSGRALGLFGLVFGVQTLPMALAQSPALIPGAGAGLMAVLYGAMVAMAIASITKVAVRGAALVFAVLYAAALVAWPFLVSDPALLEDEAPWLYYICTVATTAAVVAVSAPIATGYTLVVPAIYGLVRLLPAGGAVDPLLAVLDAMYAAILGIVVLIIVTMLRQAAESVDSAQEAALERYDVAARQHATEHERVKVDALVHDSVLTTLLTAAAARTAEEQALAARMAADAVKRLDEAGASGPRALDRVGLTVLVRRLRAALTTLSAPFTVRVVNAGGVELPVEAVDALYTAAVQAMVNSVQHADDPALSTRRELRIRGVRAGGCVIEVADNGVGFDRNEVPVERLGLRVSIEERMANAGGSAAIVSSPGEGTTVTIAWPAAPDEADA
ncbi:sensor histidine kinase [Agromyces sp. Marseille-P2726]|uniref:sensor histidine kinase n=1 Tax=Agromyces sp. Marseille-P2726 TaxID=2709132 RepID=UPI00156E4B5D|nr:ATP-binding protein [Agromyces sp. Marseille-P2726]